VGFGFSNGFWSNSSKDSKFILEALRQYRRAKKVKN